MIVELFGTARDVLRMSSVALDVAEPIELREVLAALARACPQLVGVVLDPATHAPIPPNLVLLDGRRAASPDQPVVSSDRPCLLVLPSGG